MGMHASLLTVRLPPAPVLRLSIDWLSIGVFVKALAMFVRLSHKAFTNILRLVCESFGKDAPEDAPTNTLFVKA